jgi:hypothetical protein
VSAILKEYDGGDGKGVPGTKVKFYAVSCTQHKKLCTDQEIHGYPKIKLFPAGASRKEEASEAPYWKLHPFDVLNGLGVQIDHLRFDETELIVMTDGENDSAGENSIPRLRRKRVAPHSPSSYWLEKSKHQIFDDAALSFLFNLKNGIFMSEGPLNNSTKTAFHDWLLLLKKTMPVAWHIQLVINALLEDFDNAVLSEENLVAIVDRHQSPADSSKRWSRSCTRGVSGMGYTCGLWQLFHIMTVGLVEYNLMISGNDDEVLQEMAISTVDAAETLRNFVANFFGCEVCRMEFLAAFDSCAHDRCNRLTSSAEFDQWIQLPVWLFETHNSVNVRLLKELADRENRIATADEETGRHWPDRTDCPKCWRDSGAWDEEMVYKYLRTEYWPEDFLSVKYRTEVGATEDDKNGASILSATFALQLMPLAVIVAVASVWYRNVLRRRRSGLHKKLDLTE